MDLLGKLMSGGQGAGLEDFTQRYNQGAPQDGITDAEAVSHYQQVAPQLPADVYQQSAQEAFSRLSPDQRAQFGQQLQQSANQQGVELPGYSGQPESLQDPGSLAQIATGLHQQQPGLLAQLLGAGGMGGAGAQAGTGANLGSGGGLLGGGIGRAVLGGIAAMAVQKLMTRR
ncbi:MAG: hypothetical protein DLM71_07365 [Chloroflexi bacterium]|nr:MAG: hypothetical protein DLM71_07365 [Chloroflexota bacterium]